MRKKERKKEEIRGKKEKKNYVIFFEYFLNIILYRLSHYFKFIIPTLKMTEYTLQLKFS